MNGLLTSNKGFDELGALGDEPVATTPISRLLSHRRRFDSMRPRAKRGMTPRRPPGPAPARPRFNEALAQSER